MRKRNDPAKAKYVQVAAACLGAEGMLLSHSKSGYRKLHPLNIAVFNASVCIASGEIWRGDTDGTIAEPDIAALAAALDEIVYVFYEHDGPADGQPPSLDKSVFSVTPSGHTEFQYAYLERTREGRLQRRPPEPPTGGRWSWRVLRHRPRLWRFWLIERRRTEQGMRDSRERNTLVYLGARDRGITPLLVLGFFRESRVRKLGFEFTWYPTHEPSRSAPRPLIFVQPGITLRRFTLWMTIIVWPGQMYELRAAYALRRRW